MDQKLNWGIIGTGAIAKAFARGLPASQTGKLLAVASRSQASADKFGNEFQVERRYPSYEAMLADPQVQAVYISTPHPLHACWAIRAAEAGKHILCEKPMTVNAFEAMAVIEAARQHNVFLMEAFMYRCHPQTAKLIELIKQNAIGQVCMIQATFSFRTSFNEESRLFNNDMAGGGILDVGCYPVSMSRLVAGVAIGKDFAEPLEVKGCGHLGPSGVDEWAAAVLRFPQDIVAQVSTGITVNQENIVRIFGTEGRITLPNPWTANRSTADVGTIILQNKQNPQPLTISVPNSVTAYALEADVVGRAIAAGLKQPASPAMTWDDTLGNLRTMDQWRDSIGLTYNMEKPDAVTLPVHGRPLAVKPNAPMKHAPLEGLAKPVSRLIMGVDNQITMPHAQVMFDAYFEQGGNTFDTAHIYGGGKPEQMLGAWIKKRNVRDQVVIVGKGAHTPNCNPQALVTQLQESLDRLQTDHVDLYFMHRDNPEIPVGEFVEVLNEQLKAGRIRGGFGGSNWTVERIKKANAYAKRKGLRPFTMLSNNFSLARMVNAVWGGCITASDVETRSFLKRQQMPLMAWSSQARGFFTDRALAAEPDQELKRCWFSDDNFQRRDRAIELAKKLGVDPIQIALAYVLCQPFPTFPLIGPRVPSELYSSLKALEVSLTPKQVKWLNLED